MGTETRLAEMVPNTHSGRVYVVSTIRNPAGPWETAVLENPGIVNAILGRRRVLGRTILVSPRLVYEIGRAKRWRAFYVASQLLG